MTGKPKKVTAVVEKLVDIHARDCDQEQETAEDGPWQKFADRNGNRADTGGKNDIGHDLDLPG
jgi:hypothetical protein